MQRISIFLGATLLMVALAALAYAPVALAHSEPKECTPPMDGTVDAPPARVVCQMTQSLDAQKTRMSVVNASGAVVDKGDSAVDLNDPDRRTLSVSLDPTKIVDGVYTVKWETLSTEDNEEANGEFKFTVKLAGAAQPTAATTTAAEPTTAPTAAVEPTVAPTAAPTPEPTPSTPATTLPATGAEMSNSGFLLLALLGLLFIGFGMMTRVRR